MQNGDRFVAGDDIIQPGTVADIATFQQAPLHERRVAI